MRKLLNLEAGDRLILSGLEYTINTPGQYELSLNATPEGLVKPGDSKTRRSNAMTMQWVHSREQAIERKIELLTLISEQSRDSMSGPPPCICCKASMPWRNLYKCYHCDLWFCPMCARPHFGMPTAQPTSI